MLCLRRQICPGAHGEGPIGANGELYDGPPGVFDLHDCSHGSVFMTWSDPRGANPEACPRQWECTRPPCNSCPSSHQSAEGYPKPGGEIALLAPLSFCRPRAY